MVWVFQYARRYRLALTLTVASMLALVGIQLTAPWLVRTMVAAVTDPEAGPEALSLVGRLSLLAHGVYVLRAVTQFARSYAAHVAR